MNADKDDVYIVQFVDSLYICIKESYANRTKPTKLGNASRNVRTGLFFFICI